MSSCQWKSMFYSSYFILPVKPLSSQNPSPPRPSPGRESVSKVGCISPQFSFTLIQEVNKSSSVMCCSPAATQSHTFTRFTAVDSEGNNVSTSSLPPSSAACDWLAEQCRTSRLERRRRRRWQWGGQAGGRCNEFVLMISVAQRHCNTNNSVHEQRHCCDCEALLLYEPPTQSSSVSSAAMEPSKPPG